MENVDLENKTPTPNNTVFPNVLFVGAKIYKTNYQEVREIITIERVTKTQAISENGTYKFAIEVSSDGTARRLGNTDRWSSGSFYLETPKLKEKMWRMTAVKQLKDADYSKFNTEVLKELLLRVGEVSTLRCVELVAPQHQS